MGSAERAVEECRSALMKQEGGSHYKDCKIQPVEYIHANGLGYIEGAVIKYVTRYKAKNGAEDIKKAIHFLELLLQLEYPANDAAHKAPSLCDSEVLDFSLPSIILEGTAEDCRKKHCEELAELGVELAGSTRYFVEAWDTLQAALTWKERCDPVFAGGAGMAVLQAEKLLGSFTDYNKIRHAKTLALLKNAARSYYAPEACKIILESNGERWR